MNNSHSRKSTLEALMKGSKEPWDVIIIGGGITGAGILRECARRGLTALLVERQDFAWGTSSKSSKMVHGGLRYIAAGQFKLTRDCVRERQRLLSEAPGLVEPLKFLMGHYRKKFPGPRVFNTLLRVYDSLAGHRNHSYHPAREQIYLAPGLAHQNLQGLTQFSDAVTDDARLVLRVLQEAIKDGGTALNYVAVTDLVKEKGAVKGVRLRDELDKQEFEQRAQVVINATGAWVDQLREKLGAERKIRPLRGSHLVVPHWRLPVGFSISIYHPRDKRPVFIFPWEGSTIIGTTDLDHDQDMSQGRDSHITNEEVDYLLQGIGQAFPTANIKRDDILSTWSGLRPVVSTGQTDPSREKRDHAIWDDDGMITVAGGKLTTFRLIALDALKKAQPYLGKIDLNQAEKRIFKQTPSNLQCKSLTLKQSRYLFGRHGDRAQSLADEAKPEELTTIGNTAYLWAELGYACRHEGVIHLDDLMLRRTRLGQLTEKGGAEFLPRIKPICQSELNWNDSDWQYEVKRYQSIWRRYFSVPTQDPTQ